MKQTILLCLMLGCFSTFCQTTDTVPAVRDKVFTVVEQMPEFPGGENALFKFISSNIKYPDHARDNDIQGRVVIGFVVNEDGSLSDFQIKKSVVTELDNEALRVLKLMPKFKPGKQQGKAVRVNYILPIKFSLSGSDNIAATPSNIPLPWADTPAKVGDNYTGAVFEHGPEDLVKFIAEENRLLKNADANAKKDYVLLKLSISDRGQITDIKITKSLSPQADLEALRIAHLIPKFKAARYMKRPVNSTFNMPVTFLSIDPSGTH